MACTPPANPLAILGNVARRLGWRRVTPVVELSRMEMYINPQILTWARERVGLSIDDLAARMKRSPKEIEKWESGEKIPAYGCLEDLAYKYFQVPLAVFFFPKPPDIPDPVNKFRRLPDYELERFSDDTYKKIRIAQGFQDSLPTILEGQEKTRKIFIDLKPRTISIKKFAQQARKYIGVSIEKQYSFQSSSEAFKQWRHALEGVGIFTFKDSFKDLFVSGFSLLDNEFPIIFINNSNSFTRQIFTLIHELGHILFGVNGITDIDETYFSYMENTELKVEILCNQFASEFLVPDDEFQKDIDWYKAEGIDAVYDIASQYSVSREVIFRKLLDNKIVSESLYLKQSNDWNQDYLRNKKKSSGGNYYLTRVAYLGEYFTKAALVQYHKGRIERAELANHLNCKSKNLSKLEDRVRW